MCESVTVFQSVPVRARVGMTCMPMHACISVSHSTNLQYDDDGGHSTEEEEERILFTRTTGLCLPERTTYKKQG